MNKNATQPKPSDADACEPIGADSAKLRKLMVGAAFSIYERNANRFGYYPTGEEGDWQWCTPRMGNTEVVLCEAAMQYLIKQFGIAE